MIESLNFLRLIACASIICFHIFYCIEGFPSLGFINFERCFFRNSYFAVDFFSRLWYSRNIEKISRRIGMNYIGEYLGSTIKRRRTELGMTQDELAEKLGYAGRTSIAKIEAGTVGVPAKKMVDFANVLNMTYSELIGWTYDENGVPSYARKERTAAELTELIETGNYSTEELAGFLEVIAKKLRGD